MSMSFRDMLYPENNEQSSPSRSPKRTSYIRSPSRLQDPVDTDNEIKAQQLAKMYEKRLEILKESLNDAFGIVKSDNLVDTMKNDVSTSEYAYERVKQIIEKCINDDKEALLDKLCQENANLKSECFKLDQENLKVAKQYEDRIEDLTKKLSELREKHVSEQRNKEDADDQVKNLQHLVENLRHGNEEALRKKDEQINNLRQEAQELSMYREQTEKLEDLLQENEDKYKRLQHEHNQLQKEAITLRSRHKEHDKNIDSLNSIIDDMQRIIDESQAVLKEKQKTEHDLKYQLETLTEKNEKLEASLVALNSHEKLLKDEFNYKIEKIETGILNERSEQEKVSATLENKYKKKLKQKRDKIYSYKERLAEKDKKLEEVENHLKEIFERHENEKEDIRQSLEGQKNIYEQKMLEIEEECAKKIDEMNRRNYQEAIEVQEKFEKMLEKIMRQAQEEANHKIDQITEEAKKTTQILRQKEDEIRREYIKIEYHEKLMAEKANLVDHMKHEWVNREGQITHEAELRLKEQREKITDDFNIQISILKNCMTDLERQLHHQQAQKRETETEVDFLKETNQNLKTIIKELEFEKEKTFENIEEWSIKMEKLREAYEEEERKTAELRQLLNEESRNNEETIKHLNTAYEEIAKKDKNLASVTEELQHFETKYSQIQGEHRQLESEHQTLWKESSNKMNEQEIKINSLNEENRTFKEDNKKLKDRIVELTEEFEAKWQKVNFSQNEMSLKLRKEEDQAKTLDFDVKLLQKQIADLEQNLSESERQKKEFSSENVRLKSEVNELAQEKEKIQSREQKVSTKLYLLKKQIESFAASKVDSIRTELADLKKFYNDSFNLYVKEVELKIQSLVSAYNVIQRRKLDEYIRNIEAIELRLKSEAQSLIEKSIAKSKQMQKDLVESYEYKCLEKDRQIKTVEHDCEQLREQNQRLQKDLQSVTTECNAVKEECKNNEMELVVLGQELNDKEQYFEKTKKMLLKEIDDKARESAKEQTEFVKERKSMKERYTKEIEDMKSQMESLKHKHVSSMSSYEQRMNSISLQQFEKAEELENNYKDSIQRLQITLDDTLLRKEKLNKEAELLREKNYNLEKKALDLERAKSHIESLYQKNCVEYEETIEMLQEGRSKENLKVRELRKVSTDDDINYLRALSQREREGIKSAREISDLARENEQLEQQLASLEGRIGANNKFILAKRDKLRNNPLQNYQLKETKTQGMLSPLLTSPLESPYNNQYRRTTVGNSALNYISPRLNTDYELQFASKTPKTKSYFLDQGLDRKIYSERGTLYSDYDTKGRK